MKTGIPAVDKRLFIALLPLILSLLSGCASLSKEECIQGDWYGIGYSDGLSGQSPERFGEHREACAEHGIGISVNQYRSGRSQGLIEYCTFNRGLSLGLSAETYHGVCPDNLKTEFIRGYLSGLEGELETLEDEQYRLAVEQRDKERLLGYVEEEKARQKLLDELKTLDRKIDRLRNQARKIDRMIDSAKQLLR